MGFYDYDDINWFIFPLMILMLFFPSSSVSSSTPDSFGDFLINYANNSLSTPHTGVLYNLSLPSNLSGIQVSYIRFRSGSFWVNGANFSGFFIPPKVLPIPFVKRIAIVYENFGNWSSRYFQLPSGYVFIAPVIGFTVYDSSNSTILGSQKLHLSPMGDPISVNFFPYERDDDVVPLCVRLGNDGSSFELKNMTGLYSCNATDVGYFSLVIPISIPIPKKKGLVWEWWVIGFGAGFVGLVLLSFVFVFILRMVRVRLMRKMETESERGVGFNTVWIGESKMPCATMMRTQPVLENNYQP